MAKSARPLLTFHTATLLQHGIETVRGLDWSVLPGQQWAVIGPNGSGKSAIVAAIMGHAIVSDGDIVLDERLGNPAGEHRIARISFQLQREFVLQEDSHFQSRWYAAGSDDTPTLTARQIMRGRAPNATDADVRRIAKLVGIENLLDRQALHLSSGEMRRTLIARALLSKPRLMLLDEPFIGLDVDARKSLAAAFHTLIEKKLPLVIFTTRPHDLPRGITHHLYLKNGEAIGQCRHGSAQAKKFVARAFGSVSKIKSLRVPAIASKTARAAAPIVDLRDVAIRAPGKTILSEISWMVRAGESWALMGRNGAGKTTLLSVIIGDHPQAFAQDVRLFGRARADITLKDLKARIGWASPDILLHYSGDTTTLELACTGYTSTMGLYERRSPREIAHAKQWLSFLGLAAHLDLPFRFLSDGQQRMALLARALVKNPPLLVLDEPCQGLDEINRARVLRALDAVSEKCGTTLLYVTHHAEERPRCINRVLTLENGRVAAIQAV